MIFILIYVSLCSFNETFPGFDSFITTIHTNGSSGNYYLFDCTYHLIQHMHQGGAIYINSDSQLRIKIKKCLFNYCSSKSNGGAIYISATNGQSSISQICCYQCYVFSDASGQCSFITTKNNLRNDLIYSSFSKSPSVAQSRSSVNYFSNGNITFSLCNSSNNHVSTHCICYCYNPNGMFISFSSFCNNYAASHTGIGVGNAGTSMRKIYFCNFIANTVGSYGIISVWTYGTYVTIDYSIFLDNIGYLFYKHIVDNWPPEYRVDNCYIKATISITPEWNGGPNSNSSIRTTNCGTYEFQLFSSYLCYGKNIEDILKNQEPLPTPTECVLLTSNGSNFDLSFFLSFLFFIFYE